jgi:hypothetical protein
MWSKKKKLKVWEYEPYAFEPGKVYIMEVSNALDPESVEALTKYFSWHSITIHLVRTPGNMRVLNPVEVRRGMEG